MQKLELKINEDSVFKTLGQQGLISFSDYMFLTTLLSSKFQEFFFPEFICKSDSANKKLKLYLLTICIVGPSNLDK
jgi:hypothetical protein